MIAGGVGHQNRSIGDDLIQHVNDTSICRCDAVNKIGLIGAVVGIY